MKKLFLPLLMMLFMLSIAKVDAKAAKVIDSKTEGDITWTLYDDGLLDICPAKESNNKEVSYRKYKSIITDVNIEYGVTAIANNAFYECGNLKNVSIPDSVTVIGENAFTRCVFESIIIPDSVTRIESMAFDNCYLLKSIDIPDSVTFIGSYAFDACNQLEKIKLSNSIKSIEDATFWACSELKTITIPESVAVIGSYAFCDCYDLTSINIPNGVTVIPEKAFYECRSLDKIIIPDSVNSIEENAFYGCNSLSEVIISNSDIEIGKDAFYGTFYQLNSRLPISGSCSNFYYELNKDRELKIKKGSGKFYIDYIDSEARQCKDLINTIIIDESVTDISFDDLNNYQGLTKIINNTNTEINLPYYYVDSSWCNITNTSEAIFSIANGTAIKVNEELPVYIEVVFDGNGATEGTMPSVKVKENESYKLPGNQYKKEGYILDCWEYEYAGSNCSCQDEDSICVSRYGVGDSNKIILKAKWRKDYIEVVFDGNGATEGTMPSVKVKENESYKLPGNQYKKEGYILDCWEYEYAGSNYSCYDEGSIYVNHYGVDDSNKIILKAKWRKDYIEVAFDGNGATEGTMPSIKFKVNESNKLPDNQFKKEGYVFAGWDYMSLNNVPCHWNDGASIYVSTYTCKPDEKIVLKAKWQKGYRISFDGNGATSGSMDSILAPVDDDAYIPKNAYKREGYVFTGWKYYIGNKSYEIEDNDWIYMSSSIIEENNITELMLVAQWEVADYMIEFDGNDASSGYMPRMTVDVNASIAIPQNAFTKDGYKFKEWIYKIGDKIYYINNNEKISISPSDLEKLENNKLVLVALWEKITSNEAPIDNNASNNTNNKVNDTDNNTNNSTNNKVNDTDNNTNNKANDTDNNASNSTYNNNNTENNSDSNNEQEKADNSKNVENVQENTSEPLLAGSKVTDESGNNTGYTVTNSDPDSLTVEYTGTTRDKNQKNITIPKAITDAKGNVYTVTSIKSGAFKGNKKLKKVVIPNTVTEIGSNAFKKCKKLKRVTIYANPNLKISSGAFKKISKDAVIKVKGVKGKQKEKIVKAIKKQTNAKVK